VSRGLLSPRGGAGALADLFGRTPLVDGQRVGPARRRARRARALARLARRAVVLGVVLAGVAAPLAGARWATTSPRFAIAGVEVRGASRVPVPRILAAAAIRARHESVDPRRRRRGRARLGVAGDPPRRHRPRAAQPRDDRRRGARPFTLVHAARLHWMDEEAACWARSGAPSSPASP